MAVTSAVAAVAAVSGGLGGTLIDRLPAPGSSAVDTVEAPAPGTLAGLADPRPTGELVTPVCSRAPGLDCFRWTIDTHEVPGSTVTVTRGVLLFASPGQGTLTARSLRDGRIVWRTALDDDGSDNHVVATDDLVLTSGTDGLTARGLDDGQVRWVNPDLDSLWYSARGADDDLLLAILHEPTPAPEAHVHGPPGEVVSVDATTGDVTWRVPTLGAPSLAADGTVVLVDERGRLVALEPDGTPRWHIDAIDRERGGGAWVTGRLVTVWNNGGVEQLHRLRDGQPLGLSGRTLVSDDRHTLVEAWQVTDDAAEGDDRSQVSLVLVGDDGVEWQVPSPDVACTRAAWLGDRTVTVMTCDGVEVTFDRRDGAEVDRTPDPLPGSAEDAELLAFADRTGPFLLHPEDPEVMRTPWVLTDARGGVEVARMPADAHLLGREHDGWWTTDLGGVAVIQHAGGLSAIDLPRAEHRDLPRGTRRGGAG